MIENLEMSIFIASFIMMMIHANILYNKMTPKERNQLNNEMHLF